MADHRRWDGKESECYKLPVNDPLGVLSTTRLVLTQGKHVWINLDQIELMSQHWQCDEAVLHPSTDELWHHQYHFFDGTEKTVNWLLLLDALNFCFWAEKHQSRWTIQYHGAILNGYWAEAASLKRAVEEDQIPLWDATYLRTISETTITHIFRGHEVIPLLEQRVYNAREVGRVLLEQYDGQFTNAIAETNGDAVNLALLLAEQFSSFHDIATYRGKQVRFLKRAQICIADVYGAFGGKDWGEFQRMDYLTIFADYKLPQVLRHANILEYSTGLAQRIDNQKLIPAGSDEEIEIRANTIWACELLRQTLLQQGHKLIAADIDQRIWLLAQHTEEMRPYHRTRTMYY
ncbi:MAG TPA: queuosine salvage family protein [Dictyobacter sp.]|jgi:hypothetical protein|nr:queuosine salvage family protein [Dictyobacter sp.]